MSGNGIVSFGGYPEGKIDILKLSGNLDIPILLGEVLQGVELAVPFLTKEDIGLSGDGVTDDSFLLNKKLRELWESGRAATVWLDPQDGKFFKFDASVDVRSNQWLIFSNRTTGPNVVFGANGRIRLFGRPDEEPNENIPKLRDTVNAGTTTLFMGPEPQSNVSNFAVGQRIVVRGKSDGNGVAIEKEEKTIVSIDSINNNLEVDSPFEETYLVQYPPAEFEARFNNPDFTFITRLVSKNFTSDVSAGSYDIDLIDTNNLTVGDYLYITDNGVAGDIGGTSNNFIHQETAQITAINSNTITVNHALYHSYQTSKEARVIKLDIVSNARVTGVRGSWDEEQTSRNIHGILQGYAGNCLVDDCHLSDEAGYGPKGNAFRHDIGYNNTFRDCSVERPSFIGPGEGYGFSAYGSTNCVVMNCYADRCRHSFIPFKGAAGNRFQDITSVHATISDIDCHGANELHNLFSGFHIISGKSISGDANDKAAIKLGNEFHLASCSYNVIENGLISFMDTNNNAIGIDILPAGVGNTIRNITINGPAVGVQIIDQSNDSTLKAEKNVIQNIEINNATDRAMKLRGNANGGATRVISNFDIVDVVMRGCARHIDIEQAENINIIGAKVIRPSGSPTNDYVVDATDVTNLHVTKCHAEGMPRFVRIQDCASPRIADNTNLNRTSVSTLINDVSGNTDIQTANNTDI